VALNVFVPIVPTYGKWYIFGGKTADLTLFPNNGDKDTFGDLVI